MNTDDLSKMYGFNKEQVETYIADAGFEIKSSFSKKVIRDADIGPIVNGFHRYLENIAEENKIMASIMITSGFGFEGYRIVKYSGYISGDDAYQVDRGKNGEFSEGADLGIALMRSLKETRRNALTRLKKAAYDLGCNAVVGVDFDYITLEMENKSGQTNDVPYVFGVTANGNAVIIEKN